MLCNFCGFVETKNLQKVFRFYWELCHFSNRDPNNQGGPSKLRILTHLANLFLDKISHIASHALLQNQQNQNPEYLLLLFEKLNLKIQSLSKMKQVRSGKKLLGWRFILNSTKTTFWWCRRFSDPKYASKRAIRARYLILTQSALLLEAWIPYLNFSRD